MNVVISWSEIAPCPLSNKPLISLVVKQPDALYRFNVFPKFNLMVTYSGLGNIRGGRFLNYELQFVSSET